MKKPNSFDEFRDTLWGSQDGRRTKIKDLDDSHLVNVLNWVADRPECYPDHLYGFLEQEANYRKLICFSSGLPIPFKNNEGRWELLNTEKE